jgi:hypothetical protein
MLERQGYWNYISKSSLTIKFPSASKIEPKYFWPYDVGNFVTAHAFVVAPPFAVIDLTIKQQAYSGKEKDWVPNFIIEEVVQPAEPDVIDLISPGMQHIMSTYNGILKANMIKAKDFNHLQLTVDATNIKYIQYAISAPDVPLEKMGNLILSGRRPLQLYNDVILPALEKFRAGQIFREILI